MFKKAKKAESFSMKRDREYREKYREKCREKVEADAGPKQKVLILANVIQDYKQLNAGEIVEINVDKVQNLINRGFATLDLDREIKPEGEIVKPKEDFIPHQIILDREDVKNKEPIFIAEITEGNIELFRGQIEHEKLRKRLIIGQRAECFLIHYKDIKDIAEVVVVYGDLFKFVETGRKIDDNNVIVEESRDKKVIDKDRGRAAIAFKDTVETGVYSNIGDCITNDFSIIIPCDI